MINLIEVKPFKTQVVFATGVDREEVKKYLHKEYRYDTNYLIDEGLNIIGSDVYMVYSNYNLKKDSLRTQAYLLKYATKITIMMFEAMNTDINVFVDSIVSNLVDYLYTSMMKSLPDVEKEEDTSTRHTVEVYPIPGECIKRIKKEYDLTVGELHLLLTMFVISGGTSFRVTTESRKELLSILGMNSSTLSTMMAKIHKVNNTLRERDYVTTLVTTPKQSRTDFLLSINHIVLNTYIKKENGTTTKG